MAKLNQVLAIESGVKGRSKAAIDALYKTFQKPALFEGLIRVYRPDDAENGERLPEEKKNVQFRSDDLLKKAKEAFGELFDITARKDYTNCDACADVVVDGVTIVKQAPVTFLLFLEKQLKDLQTLVAAAPTLDTSEDWRLDSNSSLYKSEPVRQNRTKKVARPLVLYPATPEHPAQTQIVNEDVKVGEYVTTRISGALDGAHKEALLARIVKVQDAVKKARERANSEDASPVSVAENIFGFIFG